MPLLSFRRCISCAFLTAVAIASIALNPASQLMADGPQKNSAVIGAWEDDFSEAIAVFLADGRVLFTFLKPPARKDWHLLGTWKEFKPGQIEVVIPSRPPHPGDSTEHQTDVYSILPESPNLLNSADGVAMVRIIGQTYPRAK